MEQRANFEGIQTGHPQIFGVKISGHLGTQQRGAVEGFVRRCRQTGRDRIIFDLSGLESMGGGVAQILGEFATEMATTGHPPWFVGASDVVQSFMTGRFGTIPPSFAQAIEEATAALLAEPVPVVLATAIEEEPRRESYAERKARERAQTTIHEERPPDPVESQKDESDAVLDALEAVTLESEEDPSLDEALGTDGRPIQLTLADAQPLLRQVGTLRQSRPILEGLLHGANLAERCHLFCLQGDRLVDVQQPEDGEAAWIPAHGIIGAILMRRAGPVDLVDLCDQDLDEQESEVLATLNCQVVVPVFVDDHMEGLFFVRKALAGEEYVPSEELALDLLARQFGFALSQGKKLKDEGPSESEQKLRVQTRRQQSVLRLSQELHGLDDVEQLVTRLLIGLIGEMGISGAVYLEPDGQRLIPRHAYSLDESELPLLEIPDMEQFLEFKGTIHPDEFSAEVAGSAPSALRAAGIDFLVPFKGRSTPLGMIGLAARRSKESGKFDQGYLETAVFQAALAAEHLRSLRTLEMRTLRVARSLITLVERKIGRGTMVPVELVMHYVARVAQELNFDKDHLRDLLYGAVLRDVGMIEISDLVLKSPRHLTPEEWKLVQRHPISGADVLRQMDFSDITCDIVLHHHERYNGEGYPNGLRGTAIPQGARIVAVVESYVAMLRDTPYRPSLSREEALDVLRENWEMRYDPAVIETFIDVVENEQPASTNLDIEHLLSI